MHNKPSDHKNHKSIFEQVKLQQRSSWLRQMIQKEQKKGDYVFYHKDYPLHNKWRHQGYELHYYSYLNPVQPAKAIIFFFPGMNSHANTSGYFAMGVAEKCQADVYALDYKNFGRSGGNERGYISSSSQLIEQAEDFIQYIVGQQKDKKKIYISGMSMGGGVCFKLATYHPQKYDGVIFLSPALKQNKEAVPFLKKLGWLVGACFPTLKIMNQTFEGSTKYDQTERILQDPYSYNGKVVPGSVKMVLDFMEEIEREWHKFSSPFILIQSGVDKLVDPFLGIDFEKACKSKDKTVIYFKDMWHGLFAQEQIPDVVEAVTQWLNLRVQK